MTYTYPGHVFEMEVTVANYICHIWYRFVVKFDPENKSKGNFYVEEEFLQDFYVGHTRSDKKIGLGIILDFMLTPTVHGISLFTLKYWWRYL